MYNTGDTVRIVDAFTPELNGLTGTIVRETPYGAYEVEIEPTAQIVEFFNSFPENVGNPEASPNKVYYMPYELEAAA